MTAFLKSGARLLPALLAAGENVLKNVGLFRSKKDVRERSALAEEYQGARIVWSDLEAEIVHGFPCRLGGSVAADGSFIAHVQPLHFSEPTT